MSASRFDWPGGLLLSLALASGAVFAADRLRTDSLSASDRAAIEAVLTAQEKAWNALDMDAFLEAYRRSQDVSFATTHGISRGWNAVREVYRKAGYPRADMGKLEYSQLEVRALGPDAALVLGHWHLAQKPADAGGVFSLVFQRFPEGWRIIHDHTSDVPVSNAAK
jgi:uncharacterized protein (TIGR02246 family)